MKLLAGRRRWAVLGAVILVLGAGGAALAFTRGSGTTVAAATSTVLTLSTGTVQRSVTTTGTIEPAQDEDLSFSTSGTVTSVAATVGKKVAKGTVLATIDDTDLQSAVTTATAAVTAAEQQVSAVASDSSTQRAAAAAALASAKTGLVNADDALSEAKIVAPFTGTVAAVTLAVGDVVGSAGGGAQTSTTTNGITLITTDAWVVNASVGTADLASLKKGLQAQITPTGATQAVFGTIDSVGIVASTSTSGSSATFPVVIDVTGSPTGLYAGGSANVTLIIKQLTDVLTVPTLAISTVNGKTVVYKDVGGKKVATEITVGDSYGAQTIVTQGVKAGDKIVLTITRPGGFQRRTTTTTGGTTGGFGGGFGGGPGGGAFPGGGG